MNNYKNQVSLLLQVLPEVATERCFALHGGTAINLFIREMPRLSVDIDLTYIKIESREDSFSNINTALSRIASKIEKLDNRLQIDHKQDKLKLLISSPAALVKIEVNQAMRGLIESTIKLPLCKKAQDQFNAFCAIEVIPIAQLFGGKICAALDRQHPRDLFDVKYILDNEGFTSDTKAGFIFCLLASKRPIHEMLIPHLINQEAVMVNQFNGMTQEVFTYDDYKETRKTLIQTINKSLNDADKNFLFSFAEGKPDWSIYNYEQFPAVQWKLQNLNKLKNANPQKHKEQFNALQDILKY